mgnify:CR=1 FL=1
MSEGIFIAIVMVLLFGFCFLYSYGGEYYIQKKAERAYQKEQKLKEQREQGLKDLIAAKRLEREEKYKLAQERSAQIRQELEKLQGTGGGDFAQTA